MITYHKIPFTLNVQNSWREIRLLVAYVWVETDLGEMRSSC